jgi:acetyltransferase-like isoleucine patch superfamily enzyme
MSQTLTMLAPGMSENKIDSIKFPYSRPKLTAVNSIVSPSKRSDDPDILIAPLIKRPIYLDYGENVHIHHSCFIDRDCYITHSPECAVSIGENTIVGVGARLLGVTHPIDWRERHGRSGMAFATDVKIGKECFVGAGVTLLHV